MELIASIIIPSTIILCFALVIFLAIAIFYNKQNKTDIIRAIYLYYTTIFSLIISIIGMFILGQTILTNTILPTQEVQLREGVSYSNNYRFNKGHMINGEESSKTFEENKTLTKSAEKKIEPIINSRVEVYNKNNIKHNINLSIAMILVGGSLFLYNKKYLNKI